MNRLFILFILFVTYSNVLKPKDIFMMYYEFSSSVSGDCTYISTNVTEGTNICIYAFNKIAEVFPDNNNTTVISELSLKELSSSLSTSCYNQNKEKMNITITINPWEICMKSIENMPELKKELPELLDLANKMPDDLKGMQDLKSKTYSSTASAFNNMKNKIVSHLY